jgi:putative pyruvate formate lyase activating enzyme
MIVAERNVLRGLLAERGTIARERAALARAMLADCHFCAHHCGVNRLAGELGICRAGATTRFFAAQTEVAEDLELIPSFAVAFSGCDLRCDFCISGASSWNAKAGEVFDPSAVAARATRALERGARTIMLLGGEPTIHLAAALDFVAELPSTAKLVWKTNAHASDEARELLDGMFDIWLADFKFGNDACAQSLARVPDYVRVVRENLLWAAEHAELIVRHLLMPGHIDCCWRGIAEWIAAELPNVRVSLRSSFWPAWRARVHAGLHRTVTEVETNEALRIARKSGLELTE